ncbi:bifunctional 3-oxoadipate enol-lactonase/4-carboxymuconolactone decarboxylase (plasmid) [Pantoea agglomerans]|uniref:bifunctional 3-oxoadipate enol-lactonase/4-carboxymuconolactone decarboxylase PcaDC n=1 Tax=Enterobacter agglomerans TaxID=549 RepID=UPI00083D1447|nr:3-oxoadipate enol-lactonase [Pantoea agglomerans]AOE42542.1 bifunctional 3-oxoadipate enol-lactonase/4-carboxymuconolactone decarboxylase [Pantoea agglomerans]
MTLHYVLEGPDDAPVILFSNSLGTTSEMWQPQRNALISHYRILRYDVPGHGASAPDGQTRSLEQLGRTVLSLLDKLGIDRVHFCGISMGGLTGLWLARFHPQRLITLTVANSAAKIGESAAWQQRAALVREQGMTAITEGAAARWFTRAFSERAPATLKSLISQLSTCDVESYADCCEALANADLRHELAAISLPVLVIAGRDDKVTTVADADAMVARIPGAQRVVLPALHLSSVEVWLAFNRALQPFIDAQLTLDQRYQQGMTVRRAVLGEAHVDHTLENLSPLNDEFQNFISRYAWGEIWTRPGLTRHARSLITIGMLIALNREAELKMHLRAAFNNGVSRDEIKELLMHAALYCGLPASNAAFHLAQTVFDEQDSAQ